MTLQQPAVQVFRRPKFYDKACAALSMIESAAQALYQGVTLYATESRAGEKGDAQLPRYARFPRRNA